MEINSPGELLEQVMSTQYFAVLNTLGEGFPYSNLVAFTTTCNMRALVFVTGRKTRKYKNMQENQNVSLLIDNRNNQPSDVSQAVAITVIGSAREEIENKSRLQAIFLNRHPNLQRFVDNPNNAMILVTVHEYIIAGFDKTQRLVIT
jgi:nitroimidazol reductase NimA-like FMN-containing flavoprotein (pyridoxamine 5'-phosphate oxidase superfamily)